MVAKPPTGDLFSYRSPPRRNIDALTKHGLVGPARAKLLLYTAELVDAPTALAFGLIDGIGTDVDEVAATIARRSQLTVHAAKAVLAGREAPTQDEKELAEGIAAFSERRAPDFGWAG
ncbi:hypothetical protein KZZ52_56875 [Dactylosporangium sp. AC04546]|uniref:enoyl-CoA hydratase/isomerase family protein n=1 Tax=Dactylosporangium sp. AC04546 TaxID=2862460 RepID=UPI002E7AF90B|nr:hypothetical protein [Dactylosporangium sp. AC04546]WVK83287.1 hypothetical protein KZZ52_56875 [Dactylosporangium sp. AC04546]